MYEVTLSLFESVLEFPDGPSPIPGNWWPGVKWRGDLAYFPPKGSPEENPEHRKLLERSRVTRAGSFFFKERRWHWILLEGEGHEPWVITRAAP